MWWNKEHKENKTEKELKNMKYVTWNKIIDAIGCGDTDKATKWINLFEKIDRFRLI